MLNKQKGLAAVETILVLAISALLFTVVISTLQFRKKASYDDSARQVLSIIARVRNQAQQGYTYSSPEAGKELFGKAIVISTNSNQIVVKNLQQIPSGNISSYGSDEIIPMPSGFSWYINTSNVGFNTDGGSVSCVGPTSNQNFNSCDLTTGALNGGYLSQTTYWLVFRNNTGNSYLMTDTIADSAYTNPLKYTSVNQKNIRFAFALPGSGLTDKAKFDSALAKYYANFDLNVPNNQSLTVVK
jgi:type II secretory pathway pseudopilin PulG